MNLEPVRIHEDKTIYYGEVGHGREISALIRGDAHFGLFIVGDFESLSSEEIARYANMWISAGLAYFAVWGKEADKILDAVDLEISTIKPDETENDVVLTASYEGDTLKEAMWQYIHSSIPAAAYQSDSFLWYCIRLGGDEATRVEFDQIMDNPSILDED